MMAIMTLIVCDKNVKVKRGPRETQTTHVNRKELHLSVRTHSHSSGLAN